MRKSIKYLIVFGLTFTGFGVQAFVPAAGGRSLLSCAEMINFYRASMPEDTELVWVHDDINELKTLYSSSTLRTEIRYCTGDKELVGSKCISGTVIKDGEPAQIVTQGTFNTDKKVEGIVALDKCKLILGRVKRTIR